MSVAFSTDRTELLDTPVDVEDKKTLSDDQIKFTFDVERTIGWIGKHDFKRVALQFPDELLSYSATVVKLLEQATGQTIFVLADTSYGSCCIDEVAAQHYTADSLVHYGPSCLSPPSSLPCLLVFTKENINISGCCSAVKETLSDTSTKLILMYDTGYHHAKDELAKVLCAEYPNLVPSSLNVPNEEVAKIEEQEPTENSHCICGRKVTLPSGSALQDYTILYIGGESRDLTNLMMNLNKNIFYTFNPQTSQARKETANVNKMLMKRYFMVEKAKEANIVGIIAGTLGVANYKAVIDRQKQLLKKVGKKSYTFVVGKLNVPKLANFMEVDVFVLVACPLNMLLDSKEFMQPIVTPYEMEVACSREWTGDYVTDFRELLPGGSHYEPFPEDLAQESYDVSLISGKMRSLGQGEEEDSWDKQIATTRPEAMSITTVHAKSAGEYLHARSWQGLEQKLGETPVTKAVQGQKGIAMGYEDEPQQ